MTDRYIVTSRTGEPAVRTSSEAEAGHYARILGGTIIDMKETA